MTGGRGVKTASVFPRLIIALVLSGTSLLVGPPGSGTIRRGTSPASPRSSPLKFSSPDEALCRSFDWAKKQALAYVFENDPVGDWYEAALPKREAFCMRDVSHQALGAHALGLQSSNLNMLRKFAANISAAKDWCSYWEINRLDRPAPVDYRNEKEFWYNLPANFDVLDCCRRMYLWTGDRAYIDDPAFLNFYRRTVKDYVERWALGPDKILTRERFMNRPSFDSKDPYQSCRGIPSYDEEEPGQTRLGIDLLAFQAAAYRSYALMMSLKGEKALAADFQERAESTCRLLDRTFWDNEKGHFNTLLLTDGCISDRPGMEVYALYKDAVSSPEKTRRTLRSIIDGPVLNIEIRSHYPEVFFRYGAHAEAYDLILELSDSSTPRREYPEVSFALVGALVNGLMGIQPEASTGGISTLSRLTEKTPWAEVSHLPVQKNIIRVRHTGRDETRLTNLSGPILTWIARFYGEGGDLLIDGKKAAAAPLTGLAGMPVLSTRLSVAPGKTVTVRIAPTLQRK
jgi:hypothetical protein